MIIIFQIMNILVEMFPPVSWCPTYGYVLAPLPSTAALWNAQDAEEWSTNFGQLYEARTIHAVSQAGELTKLQNSKSGSRSSKVDWEEWSADVSDIGTLVMIVGSLL